jgi:hypothetical protein
MQDKLTAWKARLFDIALFILFVVALAKLVYHEIWH